MVMLNFLIYEIFLLFYFMNRLEYNCIRDILVFIIFYVLLMIYESYDRGLLYRKFIIFIVD